MKLRHFAFSGLAALALLAAPVLAQTKFLILSKENWVQHGATIDLDFVHGLYYSNGFVPDITKYLSTTRSGTNSTTATDLLPTSPSGYAFKNYATNTPRIVPGLGIITEVTRTNQLFNSTAPATQTTGSLGAGSSYSFWVNGSGSATLSNGTATGCAGTASQGSPVSGVIGTAGTCVVTVTGSLNAFELALNSAATGFQGGALQVSAGATAFTGSDIISFVRPDVLNLLASGQGTVYCEITRPHYVYYANCVGGSSATLDKFIGTGSNGATWGSYSHAGVTIVPTDGGPTVSTIDKLAVSWDGTGRCIVWNGGTPACDSNTYSPSGTQYCFNINGQANGVPGRRLTFWPTKLSTAQLQKITK